MRAANREAAQGRGQGIERQVGELLYKQERRAEKYARVLEDWQGQWVADTNCRMLYGQCRKVGKQHLITSLRENQLLTGNGNMEAYLQLAELNEKLET